MRILVTNDDGIHALGIRTLAAELGREHEVLMLAPDRERSGVSHAMTLRDAGKIRRLADNEYSCSGTPADCVILTGLGALPFKPELVVSGVNHGPNLGTDIIYSGTCGAARQAALIGLPGIAVSCASYEKKLEFRAAAAFVRSRLSALLRYCSRDVFLNINAPSSDLSDLEGIWTHPSRRSYRDELKAFDAPDGYSYCFLSGGSVDTIDEEDSDHGAVMAGKVSISPILVHPQIERGLVLGSRFG